MSQVAGKVGRPPDVAITPVANAGFENHELGSGTGPPKLVRGWVVVPLLSW